MRYSGNHHFFIESGMVAPLCVSATISRPMSAAFSPPAGLPIKCALLLMNQQKE